MEIGREKTRQAWREFKNRVISSAKEKKHEEFASDLNDPEQQQVLPKVIWEECIATSASENAVSHCVY